MSTIGGRPGHPHYFGPADRRRFSVVHWPESAIRGAVVLCPPLAYEAVCAHAAFHALAARLASSGIVVMRIDYDGTSNSIGSEADDERVAAWQQTIVDAVGELRGWVAAPLFLVGLRFGATLASTVASEAMPVDGAVFWDPVRSGRRYGRELAMLSGSSGSESSPTGTRITIAGIGLSAATLSDLKQVDLQPIAGPCLVITRSEGGGSAENTSGDRFGPATEQRSLPGTQALLDTDVELSVAPVLILSEIVEWVDRQLPAAGVTTATPTFTDRASEVIDGSTLEHRAGRVGAAELFRIETALAGHRAERAVILLNNGLAPLIGPGRSWVELAAELAGHGWLAVRVDLGGIGDSPPHRGTSSGLTYPVGAGGDIAEVVADLRAKGIQEVAVGGLCSGAVLAFDGALGSDIDAIISINGRFDHPFVDRRADRRRRAAMNANRIAAIPLRKTPLLGYFARVPTFVWRILALLRIVPDPTRSIAGFVAGRRRVLLVFGEHEWGLIALRRRGGKQFASLVDSPLVELELRPDLDHSMFDPAARAEVLTVITDYLSDIWSEPRSKRVS